MASQTRTSTHDDYQDTNRLLFVKKGEIQVNISIIMVTRSSETIYDPMPYTCIVHYIHNDCINNNHLFEQMIVMLTFRISFATHGLIEREVRIPLTLYIYIYNSPNAGYNLDWNSVGSMRILHIVAYTAVVVVAYTIEFPGSSRNFKILILFIARNLLLFDDNKVKMGRNRRKNW